MMNKSDRFGCSYYPPLVVWDAVAASTAGTSSCTPDEKRPLWTQALGETLRTLSELEFLMLATSRSPAQWMMHDFAIARESKGDVSGARNGSEDRRSKSVRVRHHT
jgi:hypothetical protein